MDVVISLLLNKYLRYKGIGEIGICLNQWQKDPLGMIAIFLYDSVLFYLEFYLNYFLQKKGLCHIWTPRYYLMTPL